VFRLSLQHFFDKVIQHKTVAAGEGLNEAGDWWLELLTHSAPLEPYEPGQ